MTDFKRLLTVKELANYLGLTTKSIYTRKSRGSIPADCIVKLGESVRFDLTEVNKWIDGLKVGNKNVNLL